MAIKFTCSCGQEIAMPAIHAGKRCRCKACGAVLRIPLPAAAGGAPNPPPPAPPEAAIPVTEIGPESPAPPEPQAALPVAKVEASSSPSGRKKWIIVASMLLVLIAAAVLVYVWFPQVLPGGTADLAVIGIEKATLYEDPEMEGLNWTLDKAGGKVRVLYADEDTLQILLEDTRLPVPKGDGKGPFWVKRFAVCSSKEYQQRLANKTVPKSVICLGRENGENFLYGGSISIRNNKLVFEPGQAIWLDRSMEDKTFELQNQQVCGKLDTLFYFGEESRVVPLDNMIDRSHVKAWGRQPVVEPTTYAGTWNGFAVGMPLHVRSLIIEKDEFPCQGKMGCTFADGSLGLTLTSTLTWEKKDGQLVGMCLKDGKESVAITVKLENGRLSGDYEGKPFSGFRKSKR